LSKKKAPEPMTDEERLEAINTISNGFGQTLLTMVDGDWDLAKSIAATLLASCIAQGAFENGDDPRDVFEECGAGIWAATEAFHREFTASQVAADAEEQDDEVG